VNFTRKFYIAELVWIVTTIGVVIVYNWQAMFVWALAGCATFYYRGRTTTRKEINKLVDEATLTMGTNLVCDNCGRSPHLIEMPNNKFFCEKCQIQWWSLHCPVCGVEVPREWTPEKRQSHLDEHETKGETEATFKKVAEKGSSA